MASINIDNLNTLCTNITTEGTNFNTCITNYTNATTDFFKNYWVSDNSKGLALEIETCLKSLTTNITDAFDNLKTAIKDTVDDISNEEGNVLTYTSFTFDAPTIDLTSEFATKLPDGGIGVAEGADLDRISIFMNSLEGDVSSVLTNIKGKVDSSDVFNQTLQDNVIAAFGTVQTTFTQDMVDLRDSLKTRMDSEITNKTTLDTTANTRFGAEA